MPDDAVPINPADTTPAADTSPRHEWATTTGPATAAQPMSDGKMGTPIHPTPGTWDGFGDYSE